MGTLTAVAAASLAAAQTAYVLLGEIALIAIFTHLMFRANVLVSTSELLLTCLISVLASMVYRILTAETFGKVFQNAISIFVGKKFAATLSEEQNISLSGTRQLVTILFSDIRGFTAFCEEKDPALVVDLLNEYMGAMVKIIVGYHGNVNKFIGDGILAIFSDEDGTTSGDHPLRAVRCGVEMVQFVGKFKTGVGIHSGLAVVGNVGSEDKMEYTVLGDTVNLASRLESLNKEMKTQLILSEATKELLGRAVRDDLSGRGAGARKDRAADDLHGVRALRAEVGIGRAGGEIMRCFTLICLVSAGVLLAQPKKEEPVGLVLQPGGAKLIRAGCRDAARGETGRHPVRRRRDEDRSLAGQLSLLPGEIVAVAGTGGRRALRFVAAETARRETGRSEAGLLVLSSAGGAGRRGEPAALRGQHDARSQRSGRAQADSA